MRIIVWRTFISEIIPLLEAVSDESMSNAEGGGDDELLVEINLADVTYGGTSLLFIRKFLPQFNISPSLFGHLDSPLPPDTLPRLEKVSRPSR